MTATFYRRSLSSIFGSLRNTGFEIDIVDQRRPGEAANIAPELFEVFNTTGVPVREGPAWRSAVNLAPPLACRDMSILDWCGRWFEDGGDLREIAAPRPRAVALGRAHWTSGEGFEGRQAGGCAALVRDAFREHGLEPFESGAVREGSTALAMVEGGLGVTLMPELAVPSLPDTLVVRPVAPTRRRSLGLAARSQEAHNPALQAFLALAKQQAPGEALALVHRTV